MPQSAQNIDAAFQRDIDEIALKAIAAFGLTFDQTAPPNGGLNDPLLRWVDFTTRYIPMIPRQIQTSNKFPLRLPAEVEVGLHRIEHLLIHGGDVNPYQSKGLTLFNDTSGTKEQKRTDGLWADWGMHHLHLPLDPVMPGQSYSGRSDWLLFLMISKSTVLFIDVKEHSEKNLFSQRDLVETYIRSWPNSAEQFRLKDVAGLARATPFTDVEHKELRIGGVNTSLEVDGKVYFAPGMGITTAVTSTRVGMLCDRIHAYTSLVAKQVGRPEWLLQKKVRESGVVSPEFQLAMLVTGDLGIHEKTSNECWQIPRRHLTLSDEFFSVWHNAVMPRWAGPKVAQYWAANP